MIIDRTWNKNGKFTISYVNKEGKREIWSKQYHHIKTYEFDPNGQYNTWDNQKCSRIFKDTSSYTPNEFDLLETMYEFPEELLGNLHAMNFPKVYTCDIETEISDDFPDPELANQKVTAISLVSPDLDCIVYGLKGMDQDKMNTFKTRYLEWIDNNEYAKHELEVIGKTPRVLYQQFEHEEDMLKHFFVNVIPKIGVLAGWNFYSFDYNYLYHRMERLFTGPEMMNILYKSSPVHELTSISWADMDGTKHRLKAPAHVAIIDYMEMVDKYDYSISPKESMSLDWISNASFGAHKIKYEGTLQDLYERDYEWYYYYNAVDSLLVQLIHHKMKSIEAPCAMSSVCLCSLSKCLGQVAITTANIFEEFYKDDRHVVYDYDWCDRNKLEYEGAFCGCIDGGGKYDFVVCYDFASLYPSQVITCNLSMENIVENKVGPDSLGRYVTVPWTEEELENFRKDPDYFVSVMGTVYKNDRDYAFKKMQKDKKSKRSKYKYTMQKIDSELITEIDRLINEKTNF